MTVETLSIPIADIAIENRLIPVQDDHAEVLKASIEVHGLLQPIVVRRTPNGKKKIVLIAGARRLRACELLGWQDVPCIIREADKTEARILEVTENLARHEMIVLDRAINLLAYREAWEKKYGEINPQGGRPKNTDNLSELSETEMGESKAQTDKLSLCSEAHSFSEIVAERMGVNQRSIERLVRIARCLPKDLITALRITPIADNQSQLLAFCKLDDEQLAKAAKALEICDGDFDATMAALAHKPKKKLTPAQKHFSAVISNTGALSKKDRQSTFQQLFKMYPEEVRFALENPIADSNE